MRLRPVLPALGIAAALLLWSGAACAQAVVDQDAAALRIPMAEFKKLHAAGAIVVVDVRAAEAFLEGHIEGAISAPIEDLEEHVARLRALSKPIVTYCA